MPWFKVDDSLHAHKKVALAGCEAMGLWVIAGSWSADQLTDGWVPAYMITRWAPNAEELAARLTKAGLWVPAEHDGEQGWWFHEWTLRNPTREDVEAEREAKRIAGAAGGRASGAARRARTQAAEAGGSSRSEAGASCLVELPTRPDPTQPRGSDEPRSGARKRATRLPEDWTPTPDMIEWAKKNTPLVGVVESDQFRDYWLSVPGSKGTKLDWTRTWQVWMRKAQQDAERFQQSRRRFHVVPEPQPGRRAVDF